VQRHILTSEQAFNVVAQQDSRIAVRIADATQVDSAAMKTIATLGLVFLPGTFICVRDLCWILTEINMWLTQFRHSLALLFSASPRAATPSHRAGQCLRSSGSIGLWHSPLLVPPDSFGLLGNAGTNEAVSLSDLRSKYYPIGHSPCRWSA
jgi:hypothetical protein